MSGSLLLSLPEDAVLASNAGGEVTLRGEGAALAFRRPTAGQREALGRLADGGACEEELTDGIVRHDGAAGLGAFYHVLRQLGRRGLLRWTATCSGKRLATLAPTSAYFDYPGREPDPDRLQVLSRFAHTRGEGGRMLLESPLAHGRIELHDGRAAAFVHALGRPAPLAELGARVPGLSAEGTRALLALLVNASMAGEADGRGVASVDADPALGSWEFHDLLFHRRSREGRHDHPVGATYRFLGQLDPPPALRRAGAAEAVELDRPDLDALLRTDPPFAAVQEGRHSIRTYAAEPITVRQLGEFLYRVGRVTEHREQEVPTPRGPVTMDFAPRPYPAGGALYELELYPAVNACAGLAAGLYHYDPLGHRLERLPNRPAEVERLLQGAAAATGMRAESLQVLLVIAARFGRVAWKYASMAYALVLKDVGVLYQTMYLAATAMGLAPCGIGAGDADLFARAAGTDYYAESSVGEFLLGSKPATK